MIKCYTFRIEWKNEFDYFQFFEEYHGRMKVCNSPDIPLAFLVREKTPIVPLIKAGIKQYIKAYGETVEVWFVSAVGFEELDYKG